MKMELIKIEETLKDLISRELQLGLIPIETKEFTPEQITFLKQELSVMFACRNEQFDPKLIDLWIDALKQMANLNYIDLIMKIRVARFTKRYGTVTTLADILDIQDYSEGYNKHYKQVLKQKYMIFWRCITCSDVISTTSLSKYSFEELKFNGLENPLEHICVDFTTEPVTRITKAYSNEILLKAWSKADKTNKSINIEI